MSMDGSLLQIYVTDGSKIKTQSEINARNILGIIVTCKANPICYVCYTYTIAK